MKNATEMSIAANLAGKAISISKTTAPHAASYPFTSLFNISHGHAVGLFFERFFKFNYENLEKSDVSFDLKKRFDLIFNLFDVSNIEWVTFFTQCQRLASRHENSQFISGPSF